MTPVTNGSLPRSAPSAQGVDAAGVLALLDAIAASGLDLHSLMVLRHGHVVAEGWWTPYRAPYPHLLYSLSKSFTSTAIGIAAGEGLLSIDDPVASFFPDKVPPDPLPWVQQLKVRHILAMASGHAEETWDKVSRSDDIVRAFLALPADAEPGSLFCYNQSCTYTLSAIITKLTGQRLLDYLRPRLFDPLGIKDADWTQTAEGIDQGFSGLFVTTESIAKLGLLHLQNGEWAGTQLVPEDYLAQAHSKQVDNSSQGNPDWQQGYGFQFWMCRHDAYRGDGAYGQFCVVLPDADAVIACTAGVAEMQQELDLFWEHLLPALSGDHTADAATEARLVERLRSLSTETVDAKPEGPAEPVTFERASESESPSGRLTEVRVEPLAAGSRLILVVEQSEHPFDLEPGQWTEGKLEGYDVALNGGWVAGDQFHADVAFVRMPHRLRLRAQAGGEPTVEMSWYTTPLQGLL